MLNRYLECENSGTAKISLDKTRYTICQSCNKKVKIIPFGLKKLENNAIGYWEYIEPHKGNKKDPRY